MLYLIVILLVLDFVVGRWLSVLNARYEKKPIPQQIADIYTAEQHNRQIAYAKANRNLSWVSNSISLVIMLLLVLCGGFRLVDEWVHDWTIGIASPIWQDIVMAIVYFLIFATAEQLLSLPISVYHTFKIERDFGFNKTNAKTFIFDWVKTLLLTLLLTAALMFAIVGIYDSIPNYFWLVAWGVMAAFSLFMSYFYSQLIVPLFNKQTPLEQGELRSAIEDFAASVNFPIKGIYVMDSSRRTTHANAYFAGWGRNKRIVLYDNLIDQLSTEEIVAVLAHEIGHSKHHHTLFQLLLGLAQSLVMFVLLGLALHYNLLAGAIGCPYSFHVNILLFYILYTPVNLIFSLLGNYLSRKHEYEADNFARDHGLGQALALSLKKMSVNSLSNPNPHPAFVFVHYSHPTLVQRLAQLT